MPVGEVIVDGQMDWTGGVDSITVPTIASQSNPEGLARNQLAWLVNGTVRDGGIMPRAGWQPQGQVTDGTTLYQGGITYVPTAGDPYLLCLIGGHLMKVTLDLPPVVTDLSVIAGVFFPANQVQAFFVQAEQYVVVQCGDLSTLPMIYDPNAVPQVRQSVGLTPPPLTTPELPAGGPMVYYHGMIWIAQWNGKHRTVMAGDIIGDAASGTGPDFVDSILKVTENPLAIGGDGFRLPAGPGDIRGLQYSANLDATLGQGTLFIFTRDQVYSLTVPISRSNWINTGNAASGATDAPLIQVVQLTNGSVNDRSIVQVNGDLFYQTVTGDVASLSTAIKFFQQWGNTPVSANEFKITSRQNRALLRFVSGIEFDNRLLMAALPKQFPQGTACQAIIPMDFTPISTFSKQDPPSWGGHYEGLQWLQLFNADFGGLKRAFGLVVSAIDSTIQLWELTQADPFENGDNRIGWQVETPSFDFGNTFQLKQLVSLELWIDRLWGTVEFDVYYRPDQYPCPLKWASFRECAARNSAEDIFGQGVYPPPEDYREQYRATMVLPVPPDVGCNVSTNRPFNVAYQFQIILKVTGFCRIRGILLKALPVDKSLYDGLITCT